MGLLDRLRGKSAEQKAIDAYNLGLAAKYEGNWNESLKQNQLANHLRSCDEATLWNLGIAATALGRWDEARKSWKAYGINVNDGPGEVRMEELSACVRLDPKGAAEVVWGTRIDPARMQIDNVPLPNSNRRYADIVINDGAQEGTRTSNGNEYPVFDELGLWRMSSHSTFGVDIVASTDSAVQSLIEKCAANDIGVEDWRTMRILCAQCSRGNPGEHNCTSRPSNESRFGFGAHSESKLRQVLEEWAADMEDGARVGGVELLLSGLS
jgi:hypothetical protein